ncbi:MAG: class I SAM-dependent methyltransferase [Elusimicrobiota bacterium]
MEQNDWDDVWLKYHAVNVKKVRMYFKTFGFSSVPKDASIIDIGCGSGAALRMLKEQGYTRLKGLEPEKKLFAEQTDGLIEQGDCLDLGGVKERYDAVLILGVLHHLKTFDEIKLALRNVKKVLKPGGRFYSVEQWKNIVRTVAMTLVRDTPVGLLSPMLRMERKLLELERKELGHWLEVETDATKYAEEIGLKVIFAKKDIRYRYLVFENSKTA